MALQLSTEKNKIIMDTKLIKQYGEDILCYRLRTARHKKRMQYEDFDKQLMQLHKEENGLYEQRRNLGWEPLVPPVQKGWKRFFVLRDDVARSKQSEFFENILKKINTYDWSYRKDFIVKKRRFGRKKYVVKEQKLLAPWEWDFAKLDFSDSEKQMFHEELHYEKWNRGLVKRYVFNEPWRFILRIRPNMVTKVRKRDATIEARIEEIDSYLERNDYRNKQTKLLYGDSRKVYWKSEEVAKRKNLLKNKTVQQIIDELESEF
jgi:hypothetical protein